MFPQVGISMVKILEQLGHTIECPEMWPVAASRLSIQAIGPKHAQ